MEEIMADLPCNVVLEGWATGYDALFIVVWVMCEDRGRLASKFAAECTEGNHEPWLVLEKLRRGMAKHFKPEWWPSQFGDLPAVPTELFEPEAAGAPGPEAVVAAARAATLLWSGRHGGWSGRPGDPV